MYVKTLSNDVQVFIDKADDITYSTYQDLPNSGWYSDAYLLDFSNHRVHLIRGTGDTSKAAVNNLQYRMEKLELLNVTTIRLGMTKEILNVG